MSNATTEGQFSIGAPSQYIGGHIAIGVITLLETIVPLIMYYTWQQRKLMAYPNNDWYKYSWKAATYGGFIAYFFPFLFWCLSFMDKNMFSYIYMGVLVLFGGVYGGYVIFTTMVYQFQAVNTWTTGDGLPIWEVWTFFGVYLFVQIIFAFIGEHYLMDSIFYLMSANIKDWCEEHPGVCSDYGVLDMNM